MTEPAIPTPSTFRRVKTPTLIQMEATECGAACLGVVLGYYKRYVPLEELRLACGVSRDGSNAANMLKAARGYGLLSKAYKMELEDLYHVKLPAILFWEFNHYVVLEGFSRKKVFINDPSSGPRSISYKELDRSYTGVAFSFEKTEEFKPGGASFSLFKGLWKRLINVKGPLIFLSLSTLCLLLPGLALPAFTRIFVDEIFSSHHLAWKWDFLLSMLFTVMMAGAFTYLQQFALNRIQQKLAIQLSSQFLWHILRLPIPFYTQRLSGEIAHRMELNNSVAITLTGNLASTFLSLMLIFFYGIVMYQYSRSIALIGVASAFLNMGVLWWISRARQNAFTRQQQDYSKSVGVSINALQTIDTIKATGSETDFFSRWAGYLAKKINEDQEIGKYDALLGAFPILTQSMAGAFLLGFGAWKVMQGDLSVGMLMALQVLLVGFLAPVTQFVNFGALLQGVKTDIARLDDVLNNPIDKVYRQNPPQELLAVQLSGHLEFRNVSFGYNPLSPPLLDNLSFILKPGQRIALVGPSNSGKSTIAKLACGLLHPWSGEILYDGKKIEDIPKELLSRSIATVDKEIFLFSGTIRENLTLWDQTTPEKNLVTACKDAYIFDIIVSREKGFDSQVSEQGINFSGGERQRLEIARALITDPAILILDEATSALDSENEKRIMDNIRKRGCTCILVAHRLSTIRECEEIIVLKEGKVVQRGNHETLKSEEGTYRELVKKEEWKMAEGTQ